MPWFLFASVLGEASGSVIGNAHRTKVPADPAKVFVEKIEGLLSCHHLVGTVTRRKSNLSRHAEISRDLRNFWKGRSQEYLRARARASVRVFSAKSKILLTVGKARMVGGRDFRTILTSARQITFIEAQSAWRRRAATPRYPTASSENAVRLSGGWRRKSRGC
jgi:hypothetical protein